jgi:hypothetical protein
VGLILAKASVMRISIPIDLSSRPFIPLPCFIRSRRPTTLLVPSLVFSPLRSAYAAHEGFLFKSCTTGVVSRRERKGGRGGKRRWKALAMAVWSRRINTSGVQSKWLLLSEHWQLLNVFSRVEKTLFEERLKNKQLDDRKGREDVAALLSADGEPLSEEQVRIWVDNFRASLKRKKAGEDKQSEPNDKE